MKKALLAALLATFVTAPAMAQVAPMTTFYWQLQNPINTTRTAKMYDIDLFDVPNETIADLKTKGHTVICYFSAGTFEDWREDGVALEDAHPEVIGTALGDWPGENWLNVRSPYVRDMMKARMDKAVEKGCNGVEPDNVDLYSQNTGFSITKADTINYNNFLATEAHSRSLMIALKNSPELVPNHVNTHDFVVAEQCFKYSECPAYSPFVTAGKAVMVAEYSSPDATAFANKCNKAKNLKFTLGFYNLALNGRKYIPCTP